MFLAPCRALPGHWKDDAKQAGTTIFVEPNLVHGTLIRALQPLQDLEPGFARALFTMFAMFAMFVVVEVHPFVDGNERAARLMMNAELSAANLRRIAIPAIERQPCLQPLKRASRNNDDIAGLTNALANSWLWTCSIN